MTHRVGDVLYKGRLCVRSKEGYSTQSHPPHADLHLPLVEDFARAVNEGRQPRVDCWVGQKVSEILELIHIG